jgi:hypothetical protein
MTTILADWHLGVMVSDSVASDQHRVWQAKKVFRVHGALIGMAGHLDQFGVFLAWARTNFTGDAPAIGHLDALVMTPSGLLNFGGSALPIKVHCGRQAVGTGAMAAMAVYEALGFDDPRRAVSIVCRHDANSRGPVRAYRLGSIA